MRIPSRGRDAPAYAKLDLQRHLYPNAELQVPDFATSGATVRAALPADTGSVTVWDITPTTKTFHQLVGNRNTYPESQTKDPIVQENHDA